MRDVTTAVGAFLVLAILLTGVYTVYTAYRDLGPASAPIDAETLAQLADTLIRAGEANYPPPPTVTPWRPTPTPTPTPPPTRPLTAVQTPTGAPTPTPTPLPPPTPEPPTPTPEATATPVPRPLFLFELAGRIRHDNNCPGEYVIGTVRDAAGRPLVGITLRMQDEYGNGDTKVTKGAAGEEGRYDFVLFGPPRRIYVWVVDEGGHPLSPRVEILHKLPNSGYETFTCHYVGWRRTQ